jgi:predicted nucleic acid-binding protein
VNVLVDTSVWSLALRRVTPQADRWTEELSTLLDSKSAFLIGPIRQELLSGIRDPRQFEGVRQRLRGFPDMEIEEIDHESAADFYNRCRAVGIQGSHIDFLICAVAVRRKMSIFTTDRDFISFERVLPIRLHAIH